MCNKVKSFEEIGKYNCNLKLEYIKFLENELAKSVVRPVEFEMQRIKKEKDEKCQQEKIDIYKNEYKLSGCGTKPVLENCITLRGYITTLSEPNIILNSPLGSDAIYSVKEQYKNEYLKNNCDKVISDNALGQVKEVAEKYKGVDKERIETSSKKIRNQRIYFGVSILLVGLVTIIMFGKRK